MSATTEPPASGSSPRIVVLASGSGSLAQALIAACSTGEVPAHVVAVVSDRAEAGVHEHARAAGIPSQTVVLERGADRAAWDARLRDAVAAHNPDLVVSAGFMRLVGAAFLAEFGGRMINTHPSLLPSFPGVHGPRDALAAGVRVAGTSVFWVDAGLDTGAIIAQEAVRVLPTDTVDSLHERIKQVERPLLVQVCAEIAAGVPHDHLTPGLRPATTPTPTTEGEPR